MYDTAKMKNEKKKKFFFHTENFIHRTITLVIKKWRTSTVCMELGLQMFSFIDYICGDSLQMQQDILQNIGRDFRCNSCNMMV